MLEEKSPDLSEHDIFLELRRSRNSLYKEDLLKAGSRGSCFIVDLK